MPQAKTTATRLPSFDCTPGAGRTIRRIARRAIDSIQALKLSRVSVLDIRMDITACHANGCPLDLERLLAADDFNFAHDIIGIRRFLDRDTGKLSDMFSPRFHRRARKAA